MAPEPSQIVSGGLLRLLANTFVLLFKARHLSWRVNGTVGDGVRAIVFQDHRDLDTAADGIARRILALMGEVPPNYRDLVRPSSIRQELEIRGEMAMIPLEDDTATDQLLGELASCHRQCQESLASLIRRSDQSL